MKSSTDQEIEQKEQITCSETTYVNTKHANSESSISLKSQLVDNTFTSDVDVKDQTCKKQKNSVGRRSSEHKKELSRKKPCEANPPVISNINDDVIGQFIEETGTGKMFEPGRFNHIAPNVPSFDFYFYTFF